MLAVSNTSPIANLAVIDHLHLLPRQFSRVHIPRAVERELGALPDQRASHLIREARTDGWLQLSPLSDRNLAELLSIDLDLGESEAIALARELRADRVLLDEREAPSSSQTNRRHSRNPAADLGTAGQRRVLCLWRSGTASPQRSGRVARYPHKPNSFVLIWGKLEQEFQSQ